MGVTTSCESCESVKQKSMHHISIFLYV